MDVRTHALITDAISIDVAQSTPPFCLNRSEAPIQIFNRQEHIPLGVTQRRVSVFSLKERAGPNDRILYCSDGQSTHAFAREFYRINPSNLLWFVGVDCSTTHRNAEYDLGCDEERCKLHESFFSTSVLEWVGKNIGMKHCRERTGVFGYSCGGAFAASMGIRNPELYGTIFAFSIAGRPVTNFDLKPDSNLSNISFFLRSGSREPSGMRSYMKRLEKWLNRSGASVDNSVESGGHEFSVWSNALNETIRTAFLNDM